VDEQETTERLERAAKNLEAARVTRDLAIREAAKRGLGLRTIGAAVGLAPRQVEEIVGAAPKR
jgi:hypothetical protein